MNIILNQVEIKFVWQISYPLQMVQVWVAIFYVKNLMQTWCWGWATLQSNICQAMGNQSEAN